MTRVSSDDVLTGADLGRPQLAGVPVAGVRPISTGTALGPRHGRVRLWFRDPAWPLQTVLVGFPVFWALGLGEFSWPLLAVPMAYQLWRRQRPIRVPPYFGLWLALMVWVVVGGLMIGEHLDGTLAGSGGYTGWAVRLIDMLTVTIVLLYVGNLTEAELPTRRVYRMLGFLFGVTVVGGLLGVLLGNVSFTSPFEMILPHGVSSNFYVQQLVHPGFSQVQDVLGYTSPRPKAPYAYTNYWGNNFSLLLIWFIVVAWVYGSRRSRRWTIVVCCVAAIPAIYSLNRGLWIGLGLSLVFVLFKLAARGRVGLLAGAMGLVAIGALVFTLTPLNTIVSQRLQHGDSNSIRASLDTQAVTAAEKSPIIGWGTGRSALGSPSSIAIGKTAACPACGNRPIGSTGEIWEILISNGFLGAFFFVGFFVLVAFHYRGDRSPEGTAARLVLYLAPFYSLFYANLPTAMSITFISLGLLWRSNSSLTTPPRAWYPTRRTHAVAPTESVDRQRVDNTV